MVDIGWVPCGLNCVFECSLLLLLLIKLSMVLLMTLIRLGYVRLG